MDFKYRYSNFNDYPHYVYATAFLVNGKLADYKIGDAEKEQIEVMKKFSDLFGGLV